MANFEFNHQLTPQSSIIIDDLGQCCIEGYNDDGEFYYLIITTSMGTSTIVTYGPVVPDIDDIPDGYNVSLIKESYDLRKLNTIVSKWLNGRMRLTGANLVDINDATENIKDVKEYLMR